MLVLEYLFKAKPKQYQAIDEAIRTVQFIRNKAIRYWMDAPKEAKINRFALNKYSTELRKEFPFLTLLGLKARGFFVHRLNLLWQDCSNQSSGRISH
jgi:putative transposase